MKQSVKNHQPRADTNTFEYHLRYFYYGNKQRMSDSLSKCVQAYQTIDLSNKEKSTKLKILNRINQYLNWIELCKM